MDRITDCGRNSVLLTAVFLLFWITTVHSIDCFKCVSMNGKFPACDDPFHNNHSLQMLEAPCMGGRKGRDGLFPATSCIKIAGVFDDTKETITVRGCGLDSGTATTDTEIIRMSHCGRFYYDNSALQPKRSDVLTALFHGKTSDTVVVPTKMVYGLDLILKNIHVVDNDGKVGRYVHGCLQSCNDADACNSSDNIKSIIPLIVILFQTFSLLKS